MNLSVLPASCRQKKLGSADETSAARCWGARSLCKVSWLPIRDPRIMETANNPEVPLIGSPYDLRVALGEQVGETGIRAALESGESGFVHSFTTGSAVDGPGVRIVAWLAGCQFRCVYCHNPDTWKMTNGIPVPLSRAVEQVQKYRHGLQTMKAG